MKKQLIIFFLLTLLLPNISYSGPIISGISSNEINIDTKFRGTQILLFGAKGDAGNIVIAVRGPKKNFLITKKEKLLGIWHNGSRMKFKDSYSYYSFFSASHSDLDPASQLLSELELGRNNLKFNKSGDVDAQEQGEFEVQFVDKLEKSKLYSTGLNKIDFLDETLFKVSLNFPKNIARGTYSVEIYLIDEDSLVSFQSIPIYVNQVGLSARILDFAYQESFLYGLLAVAIALVVGWLTNYLFARFLSK